MSGAAVFRYDGFGLDAAAGLLLCHYSLGPWRFTERVGFAP